MVLTSHGDGFISDTEEELCPLCVEEMDLSDKNFKPCPCGYQVCQFCYNNIRENPELNGRCPACRRPYDDESVEYRMVTQEEWKQDHMRQTRKEKERKQKERERKETEQTSRKHLAGMRVIQKNLVYVIGLNPNIPTDELHETLRGDSFFGQYGKIQKIVINKRNNANGNPGLGVYVTFARKEDAARCIAAVDGSLNDGKYLRAAYGTTKYCSSYLRGHQCPNPNCMFLHEPGEEADSYTRQDLSTIRHAARQGTSTPRNSVTSTGIPAGPGSARSTAEDSGSDDHESALPPGVSWAQKASPPVANKKLHPLNKAVLSRRSTTDLKTQTTAPSSPQLPTSIPSAPVVSGTSTDTYTASQGAVQKSIKQLSGVLDSLANGSYGFVFSSDLIREEELYNSSSVPTFFAFSKDPIDMDSSRESLAKFAKFFGSLNKTTDTAKRDIETNQPTLNIQQTPSIPLNKGSYGSNTQNSHELLAHLMNGGKDTAKSLSDRMSLMSSQIVTNRALVSADLFTSEGSFLDRNWRFNREALFNEEKTEDVEVPEDDNSDTSHLTDFKQKETLADTSEVENSMENSGLSTILQNLQEFSKKKESDVTLTEQELLEFVYVLENLTHKVENALNEGKEDDVLADIKQVEDQWTDENKSASSAVQKIIVNSLTKNSTKWFEKFGSTVKQLKLIESYSMLRNCISISAPVGITINKDMATESDDIAVLEALSTVKIKTLDIEIDEDLAEDDGIESKLVGYLASQRLYDDENGTVAGDTTVNGLDIGDKGKKKEKVESRSNDKSADKKVTNGKLADSNPTDRKLASSKPTDNKSAEKSNGVVKSIKGLQLNEIESTLEKTSIGNGGEGSSVNGGGLSTTKKKERSSRNGKETSSSSTNGKERSANEFNDLSSSNDLKELNNSAISNDLNDSSDLDTSIDLTTSNDLNDLNDLTTSSDLNDLADLNLGKYINLFGKLNSVASSELYSNVPLSISDQISSFTDTVENRFKGKEDEIRFNELIQSANDGENGILKSHKYHCSNVLNSSERQEARRCIKILHKNSNRMAAKAIRAAAMIG